VIYIQQRWHVEHYGRLVQIAERFRMCTVMMKHDDDRTGTLCLERYSQQQQQLPWSVPLNSSLYRPTSSTSFASPPVAGEVSPTTYWWINYSLSPFFYPVVVWSPCKGVLLVSKGKGKGLVQRHLHESDSWPAALYNLGISEVAADRHEPMLPQRIMWPSIARDNGQLDPRCS